MHITRLIFETDRRIEENASKLRGYIGGRFREYSILHNHTAVGVLNVYPRVQYRVLEGVPMLVGLGKDARRVLAEVADGTDVLKLGQREYKVSGTRMFSANVDLRPTREMVHYRFITPWLALNPGNYKKYMEMRGWKEKKGFLNGILVGNILSMCKGLGVVVNRRLFVHSHLDAEKTEYKGTEMLGFTGKFKVNFKIPDFFALGKGVSQGWGTVRNEKGSNETFRSFCERYY